MVKKTLLALVAVLAVVGGVAAMSAYEAHVINVTAKIENALSVNTESIDFGTVFPQEHLDKPLVVQLSQSFIAEERVDDVRYFIRQKPKCGITSENGEVLDHSSTVTGHVNVDPNDPTIVTINCGEPPREPQTGESWGVLPSLCEYISKEPDEDVVNDGSTLSFHEPWIVNANGELQWADTPGYLSKEAGDEVDNWTIDLAVPCFGGYCAQDWATYVRGINAGADPNAYVQPSENEHKIFGCDLWIEVTGVSETLR